MWKLLRTTVNICIFVPVFSHGNVWKLLRAYNSEYLSVYLSTSICSWKCGKLLRRTVGFFKVSFHQYLLVEMCQVFDHRDRPAVSRVYVPFDLKVKVAL